MTHPYASFLVGGGSSRDARRYRHRRRQPRRLWGQRQQPGKPAARDRRSDESPRPPIFIRITDQASGGWGHINFDDFRFHSTRPRLQVLAGELPTPEATALYPHAGLSPQEAAKAMTVPPGFKVQVVAAEPDVQQPIAMAIDDRGRLWVAEAYDYPRRAQGDKGRDRILIFEDTDGDGKFDKRTVFYREAEPRQRPGGRLRRRLGRRRAAFAVHSRSPTATTSPTARRKVLLDGWGYQDTHETLNTLHLGTRRLALRLPRRLHALAASASPARPTKQRMPINAGIWRYHPTRHEFEVFAHGTSNPWGVDFNDHGQAFLTACVIPHLFHIIQGGRYQRQAGQHFNPHTYDDIKTIADHRHCVGDQSARRQQPLSDAAGGGHAHAGAMIYLGGNWPDEVSRPALHEQHPRPADQHRSCSTPERHRATSASHGPDFLLANDRWSQIINLQLRPRRRRVHDRLVRQARVPRPRPEGARPHATAGSSRSLYERHQAGRRASIWRS